MPQLYLSLASCELVLTLSVYHPWFDCVINIIQCNCRNVTHKEFKIASSSYANETTSISNMDTLTCLEIKQLHSNFHHPVRISWDISRHQSAITHVSTFVKNVAMAASHGHHRGTRLHQNVSINCMQISWINFKTIFLYLVDPNKNWIQVS